MNKIAEHLDIRGNRKGYLFFLSIRLKDETVIKTALVAGNTVLQHKPTTDTQIERFISKQLKNNKIITTTYHHGTLYLISKSARALPYQFVHKTRAFHALRALAVVKVVKNMDEFTNLCRYCAFFSQKTTSEPQSWRAWWKMAVKLVQPFWVKLTSSTEHPNGLPFSLGVAKWMGSVANRTRRLVMDPSYTVLERPFQCEVMFSQENMGVMFNMENEQVTYVSPMIVSHHAFKPDMRDNSGVECRFWAPLFVDKFHWKDWGMAHYLTGKRNIPEKLHEYIVQQTQGPNEKYEKIVKDLAQLLFLLKK